MKSLSNNKVSVQSLNGQSASRIISDNSTQIDQEIHDRKAADAQLQSEIDGLEDILNNGIPFDPNIVPVSNNDGNLTSSLVTNLELNTLLGNTLNIHDEFDALDIRVTDVENQITQQVPNRAIISDGTGALTTSIVTAAELENVSGSTSNIQGQIDGLDNRLINVESDVSDIEVDLTNKYDKTGGTINGNVLLPADRWLNLHDVARGICSKSGTNGNIFFRNVYAAGQHTTQGLFIWENGGFSSVTEKMRLNGYGNLGIGTASPQEKLHVNGNSLVNGSIRSESLSANTALIADGSKNLVSSTVTATELAQLVGVASPVQTQLNSKVNKSGDTMTGILTLSGGGSSRRGVIVFENDPHSIYRDSNNDIIIHNAGASSSQGSLIFMSGPGSGQSELFRVSRSGTAIAQGSFRSEALTANRAVVADGSKNLVSSAVTVTELAQLVGVTSNIQNQLDSKFDMSGGTVTGNLTVTGTMTANDVKVSPPNSPGVAVINDQGELTCEWPLGSYPAGPIDTGVSIAQLATLGNINPGFFIEDRLGTMNLDIATLYSDVAGKQDTITGAATSITSSNLTANRVAISNGSGKVAASSITSSELGCLSGATSNIQQHITDTDSALPYKAQVYRETSSNPVGNPKLLYGMVASRSTSDAQTVNFPSGFSFSNTASYSVSATIRLTSNDSVRRTVYIINKTTTSFQFRTIAGGGGTSGTPSTDLIDWICVGF